MAFVFRAEKKDPTQVHALLPGPGEYIGPERQEIPENKIPFLSSTLKDQFKTAQDPYIGPGTYEINRELLPPDKTHNIFFMPADPNSKNEPIKATSVFKSNTKRFEDKVSKDGPGPGNYIKPQEFGKKIQPQLKPPSKNLKLIQARISQGRTVIPSIPSQVHSYGYTENDEHNLVLNKDPLAQAQQYVGPGYYEVKDPSQGFKYRGTTWSKSAVKKVEDFTKATATSQQVGPGTYEPKDLPAVPTLQNKTNAAFASTSTRSFDAAVKQKLGFGKFRNKTPVSTQSDIGPRGISAADTDIEDEFDDEYIKDATPGPGYYHNESLISSFALKSPASEMSLSGGDRSRAYLKTKPLGFGRTTRFKDQVTTTKEIGPGDYDVKLNPSKLELKAKVPFQSSNTRFDRYNPPINPGPGTYDPPANLTDQIVDRVQNKAKSGYVGSFGITEKRFKISKLIEVEIKIINFLLLKETPGPGTYTKDIDEDSKSHIENITAAFSKGSHYFASSTQRAAFTVKPDNVAAPGTYSINYYDISTKLAKIQEETADLPKRHPFSSTQARFDKPKEKPIPENDDEDDDDEPRFGATKNLDSLLKPKEKGKPNAVFQSSTVRTVPGKQKDVVPGPGTYHDTNSNIWNKRTFNIHFTGD